MCVTRQWKELKIKKYVEPGFYDCETDPEAFDTLKLGCGVSRSYFGSGT
jgi:hypothetical protein